MTDWQFLYQRFLRHRRRSRDGLFWDYCSVHIEHNEDFLNEFILRKGKRFIDIGASAGAWTIRASSFYEQVICFEPNPKVYTQLQRNLWMNRINNVISYPFALDDRDGETLQHIIEHDYSGSGLGISQTSTRRLDGLNLRDISTVKIDVEGSAYRLVSSGIDTFEKSCPIIIVEVHTEEESRVPSLLDDYVWEKRYRFMPEEKWIYTEDEKQVFLVGHPG